MRTLADAMPVALDDLPTADQAERLLEQHALADRQPARTVGGMAGAPERYAGKRVDALYHCCPAHERAIGIAQRYVGNWPKVRAQGNSLIFHGGIGTTKTATATAIGNGVAAQGGRALYASINGILLRVKETWRDKPRETETDVYQALLDPDLLVIDELGRQRGTEHELLVLAYLLDRRYMACKPTIVISNLTLAGIQERIGEAAMSRLRQGGVVLHFDWPDQRAADGAT